MSFNGTVHNGEWTIAGIPADFSGTLRFHIEAEYNGNYYITSNAGSWTPGESTSGIPLNASLITVHGSFTAKENASYLTDGPVGISAFRESVLGSGNFDVYLGGDTSPTWSGTTCSWTLGLAEVSPPAPVQLYINIGGNSVTETISTLGTSDYTISPTKNYNFTVLRGTIGDVTVNGNTPNFFYMLARTSDDQYYGISMDEENNWHLYFPEGLSETVTIEIQAEYAGNWSRQDIYTWNPGSSPYTGIDLGDINVDIGPVILSGTIGTGTVNECQASNVSIYAKTSDYTYWTSGDSPWQIGLPDGFLGDVTIGVQFEYNGGWYEKDVTTRMVSGLSIADINLGNPAFTFTSIGGTVTTNGTSPLNNGQLYVFDPSGVPEFESQPLGIAKIIDGDFSGYVTGGFATGYVVIFDAADASVVYISSQSGSPAPVSIGTSMSHNLSTMISVPGMSGGGGN
jgi:hypothetical protein